MTLELLYLWNALPQCSKSVQQNMLIGKSFKICFSDNVTDGLG